MIWNYKPVKYDKAMELIRLKWWEIVNWVYDKIRRYTWNDYDANEDFICCTCGRPVYDRVLSCSDYCNYNLNQLTGEEEK